MPRHAAVNCIAYVLKNSYKRLLLFYIYNRG